MGTIHCAGALKTEEIKWRLCRSTDRAIYYEVHGHGQAIIFLSETACDGEVWKIYQVPEFSKNHRVIIHDYCGTGRSSKPSIDYTTQMFAQDVIALMDHLEVGDAIVVGHSMGGRVAQIGVALPGASEAARARIDRFSFPKTEGLPFKICKEMIEWGYEKYERDHSILVGFTDEFVKTHPDRVEHYLQVRMQNLCPVEFYLRHLLARQSHDTSGR